MSIADSMPVFSEPLSSHLDMSVNVAESPNSFLPLMYKWSLHDPQNLQDLLRDISVGD